MAKNTRNFNYLDIIREELTFKSNRELTEAEVMDHINRFNKEYDAISFVVLNKLGKALQIFDYCKGGEWKNTKHGDPHADFKLRRVL